MPAKQAIAKTPAVRQQIELRAYLMWESEGRLHGKSEEYWRRAEAEILGVPKPKAPPKKAKTKAAPKTKRAVKPKKK